VVEGEVIEVVKGGLILDIGLRGFLPASLVEMRRVKDLTQYLGRSVEAKIIELDKNRNNVVLSRRAHLEKQKSNERKEFLEGLTKGTRRIGTVSSIVNFGAFVDLGGVDGLIHISELSWSHVDHPSEVLAVGQELEVEILDVDLDRERVSLSLKKAQEDPWETLAKEKPAGSTVGGKVTKIVPFGSFVEIAPGVEGLVHISELAWEHVEFPEEVVSVGEQVEAKIIDIDLERRRISLSLKQITGPGEQEYDETGAYGSGEPNLVEAGEYGEGGETVVQEPEVPVDHQEIASAAAELAAEVEAIETDVNAQGDFVESPVMAEVTEVVEIIVEEPEPEPVVEPEPEPEVVEVVEVEVEPEPEVVEVTEVEIEVEPEPEAELEPETESGEALQAPAAEVAEGDSSLESILADMRKKGQDE
jgi:small subunit ribosomal protein S1